MSDYLVEKLWEASLKTNSSELDLKHKNIIEGAKKYNFKKFKKNFRNWSLHNDCGAPYQFNFYSLKSYGLLKFLRYSLGVCKSNILHGNHQRNYFFDDIKIINLINSFDILEKCPVHKPPGNNIAYFLNNKISSNLRWSRYIYFTGILRNFYKDEGLPKTILDIGSFYGGFQYVIKNIFPSSKQILVDFPHQLSRSLLFLKESFPNSNFYGIYDNKTFENFFNNHSEINYDFLFLSTDFYHKFSEIISNNNLNIDLVTNFYSFGEMRKNTFESYLNSYLIKNAKTLYFCNRFDSSPFYEKTYQDKSTILDYLINGFEIKLIQNSGIHQYQMPVRKLFDKVMSRPISSGYFDLIQSRNL